MLRIPVLDVEDDALEPKSVVTVKGYEAAKRLAGLAVVAGFDWSWVLPPTASPHGSDTHSVLIAKTGQTVSHSSVREFLKSTLEVELVE